MANQPLSDGIIVPMITPLVSHDQLDHEGLENLVQHFISGKVHGIFALGSTGEGPSLSYSLRIDLIERLCDLVNKRVPVLIGITDTAFVESIRMAQFAEKAGADAVVLSTPYYFPAGQTELRQYLQRLLPLLPLPVVLYNMPSLTKVWYHLSTIESVIGFKQIVAIKDSSGDKEYLNGLLKLRKQRPDWKLFVGPESELIEFTTRGGNGGVSGGANVYPKLFVEAWLAASKNESETCRHLQSKIESLGKIYEIGKYASRHIKATKCAAKLLGLCDDAMAEPFNRFYPEDQQKVLEIIRALDW